MVWTWEASRASLGHTAFHPSRIHIYFTHTMSENDMLRCTTEVNFRLPTWPNRNWCDLIKVWVLFKCLKGRPHVHILTQPPTDDKVGTWRARVSYKHTAYNNQHFRNLSLINHISFLTRRHVWNKSDFNYYRDPTNRQWGVLIMVMLKVSLCTYLSVFGDDGVIITPLGGRASSQDR